MASNRLISKYWTKVNMCQYKKCGNFLHDFAFQFTRTEPCFLRRSRLSPYICHGQTEIPALFSTDDSYATPVLSDRQCSILPWSLIVFAFADHNRVRRPNQRQGLKSSCLALSMLYCYVLMITLCLALQIDLKVIIW